MATWSVEDPPPVAGLAPLDVADVGPDAELDAVFLGGERLLAASLAGADLRDVRFEDCDLTGLDLSGARLERVRFDRCRLSSLVAADLDATDVRIADCRADGAWFRMARLRRTEVLDTDLAGADLYGARLVDVRILRCALDGAELSTAVFERVDLHGSSLVDLRGAGALRGARIERTQLVALAPSLALAVGIVIDDDTSPSDQGIPGP